MGLLQSVSLVVCLCLLLCMAASAAYLLHFMRARSRRRTRVSLSAQPAATAIGVFVLSLVGAVLVLVISAEREPITPAAPSSSAQAGDTAAFMAEARTVIGQVALGTQDAVQAQARLESLKDTYLSPPDTDGYQSAVLQLKAAQKAQQYLAALQAGDNRAIDRMVRFYYEDYQKNCLQYSEVPEYQVFAMVCEDKLFANDLNARAIIESGTVTYMDYCMQTPATKTRFEIMLHLSDLLKDLGLENAQADSLAQKANRALRMLTDGADTLSAAE